MRVKGSSAMVQQVEVEGLRIAYERAGSGPMVALAHGFVGDGLSTWGEQIEALSGDFTVVAWDAPGAGRSSDPPDWFRAADYADCLVAFLQALRLSRAHLVGLSFGGIVALSVTERHPGVPTSLGLVSAYAGWRGSLSQGEVDARLRNCLRLSELPPEEFAHAMVPSMFSATAPESAVAAFAHSVRRFSAAGFRAMTLASAEADLRHVLPEVRIPTLLVYGDQDVRAPLEVAEGIRSGIPSSRLVVLPGVGHVGSVEAPEAVSRELADFLRSVEVGTDNAGS
jgi:pimeloyl-ACP methyl ester carboxylesterase